MIVSGLDHIVLTVRSIKATSRFYSSVLGMKVEYFGEGRVALKFGCQKINLHEHGNEFEPRARNAMPGAQDLCFLIDSSIEEMAAHLGQVGISVIEGPVRRTGATGPLISIYIRDLDENLIELAQLLGENEET